MKIFKLMIICCIVGSLALALFSCNIGATPVGPDTSHGDKPEDDTLKEENGTVESTPIVKTFTVVFDYNDGSGKKTEIKIPEGETIEKYAPYTSYGDREIVSWSGNILGAPYEAPITENVKLYAQWRTFELVVYKNEVPSQINDRYAELYLNSTTAPLTNKVLRISPTVKKLSIISDGTVFQNAAIIISERSGDLELSIDSLCYTSSQSTALYALGQTSKYKIKLDVKNDCLIDCSKTAAVKGSNGANCIEASYLEICGNGTLTLIAGNGADGENMPTAAEGKDGADGGYGRKGGSGIVAETVEINTAILNITAGNGGRGGKGGNGNNKFLVENNAMGGEGGKGGDGGDAIIAKSFSAVNATLNLIAGHGATGGKGGDAGGSAFPICGIGGDGGNGGNGGDVFCNEITYYNQQGCVLNYEVGNGGDGGKGGNTPDGGSWANGEYGANGYKGFVNVN